MEPSERKQGIRLIVIVLVALAVTIAVVDLMRFRTYIKSEQRFCASCHEMAPEMEIWTEDRHQAIRCQSCHHQSLREGLTILRAYLMGSLSETTHAGVDLGSCASCHETHDPGWNKTEKSVGHTVHVHDVGLTCLQCHGRRMHFQQPARDVCLGCHQLQAVGPSHELEHCLACHAFIEERDMLRPTRPDCLRCHANQSPAVRVSVDAPMQFVCSSCHLPHSGEKANSCDRCHNPSSLVGLHTVSGHRDCLACHEPHEWVAGVDACKDCHAAIDEHFPGQRCRVCHGFEQLLRTGPQ